MARLTLLALIPLVGACASIPPASTLPPSAHSPFDGYASARYRDDHLWLCRPDLPHDACHGDLAATEVRPDGTRAVVQHVPAPAPKVDCFYVYPTVDLSVVPGNHTDFRDLGPIQKVTMAQAANFTEACALYVPLYRQVTIGTYLAGTAQRERRLDVAFSDVLDAFAHYLGQYNHGRKVVLIGHSQGGEMVVRLVKRLFDRDPVLRERLLLAMPIGAHVEVPEGRTTGGTFDVVPVCTQPDERACIVAYRSFEEDADPADRDLPKTGNETVCVNPAALGDGGPTERVFSRTYFPARDRDGIHTPFALFRGFYAGRCKNGLQGFRFLAVTIAPPARGDVRKSPIDFDSFWQKTSIGLHILDMQFPQGDLIDLVARRAATLP